MNRAISLLLAAILISFNICFLASCMGDTPDPGPGGGIIDGGGPGGDDGNDDNEKNTITVPVYKDYERDTVNFSEMTYKRPDIEKVSESFADITALIEKNSVSFDEQLEGIIDLEDGYNNIYTMLALANIGNSVDASDEFWAKEHEFITTSFPSFSKSVESLFIAAANSPHAEKFEDEYFGDDLIEEYKDGGIYSDKLVELMEEEAKLESQYSSISTATVEITYKGQTDTVDNILKIYNDKYSSNKAAYLAAESECMRLYNDMKTDLSNDILIELFKIRSHIGSEYEDGDYIDFAYDAIYHDYSPEKIFSFINDVRNYVIPVYDDLYKKYAFNDYKKDKEPAKLNRAELINSGYDTLLKTDEDLAEIYAYMLQHELYSIDAERENRFSGAFTAYLPSYNAPYILMTTSGNTTDYTTLFHEFGHFADSYINYNGDTSLDLAEVSSQGLELLMLSKLGDALGNSELLIYHTRYELEEALLTLIIQSFYALFEHFAYSIPTEDISKETLDAAVLRAAMYLGLNPQAFDSTEDVMIPHIFLYPTYVQSYVTSITSALEIYFLETDEPGRGFETYKTLIDREDSSLTFEEHLERAGLSSPFKDGMLKRIADKIYYAMLGKHYYETPGDNAAA